MSMNNGVVGVEPPFEKSPMQQIVERLEEHVTMLARAYVHLAGGQADEEAAIWALRRAEATRTNESLERIVAQREEARRDAKEHLYPVFDAHADTRAIREKLYKQLDPFVGYGDDD